jgi:hypothetical protein
MFAARIDLFNRLASDTDQALEIAREKGLGCPTHQWWQVTEFVAHTFQAFARGQNHEEYDDLPAPWDGR